MNWQEKVRQYKLLVKTKDKFSNATKLTILQHAISLIEHLKQVKDAAEQFKVSLGYDITYEGHEKLLKQTAISHDSKIGFQPAKATRRVSGNNMEHYEPPDPHFFRATGFVCRRKGKAVQTAVATATATKE